MATSDNF